MREYFYVMGLQILILDPPYDHVVFSLSLGCRSFFFVFFLFNSRVSNIVSLFIYVMTGFNWCKYEWKKKKKRVSSFSVSLQLITSPLVYSMRK
jgi:hypothetical protein